MLCKRKHNLMLLTVQFSVTLPATCLLCLKKQQVRHTGNLSAHTYIFVTYVSNLCSSWDRHNFLILPVSSPSQVPDSLAVVEILHCSFQSHNYNCNFNECKWPTQNVIKFPSAFVHSGTAKNVPQGTAQQPSKEECFCTLFPKTMFSF